MPSSKLWLVPAELCGETVVQKLARVREKMAEEKAQHLLISKLDDIMWLYNIRANDVECNPVALSYTLISKEDAVLFLQKMRSQRKQNLIWIQIRFCTKITAILQNILKL